jgi:hypothetical protein
LPPDLLHFRRSGDYKAITPICKPLFDFLFINRSA